MQRIMVMAIETQYRQSLFTILNVAFTTPSDPPGLRRLRFPSFNLLVKEHLATPIPSRPNLTGSEDNEAPTGMFPVENYEVS